MHDTLNFHLFSRMGHFGADDHASTKILNEMQFAGNDHLELNESASEMSLRSARCLGDRHFYPSLIPKTLKLNWPAFQLIPIY